MLTKEQIRDRLRTKHVDILPSRTALFAAVPEQKTRYVVALMFNGDGVSSRTVDIEKLEEDDSYTMKFRNIAVSPADHVEIPESGYDIENPILTLEGGTRLYGTASGNTLYGTVLYFDTPEI